jgi:minimal PKS acyl carrier protein
MTIDDFRRILIGCAGESDAYMDADVLDVRFDELGYDSLALMESAARIEDEFGVKISEGVIHDLETPRQVLDLVNGALVQAQ